MKTILSVLVIAFVAVFAPARADAQAVPPIALPVTITDGAATLDGDFFLEELDYVEGVIVAIGTVTFTVTDPETGETTEVTEAVAIPVTNIDASCELLVVELDDAALEGGGTVGGATLEVAAGDAPDTNLDNLLCSVGHLVGSNASGNAIAKKLNKILAIVSAVPPAP
jgi:hypothetical protein